MIVVGIEAIKPMPKAKAPKIFIRLTNIPNPKSCKTRGFIVTNIKRYLYQPQSRDKVNKARQRVHKDASFKNSTLSVQ